MLSSEDRICRTNRWDEILRGACVPDRLTEQTAESASVLLRGSAGAEEGRKPGNVIFTFCSGSKSQKFIEKEDSVS